MRGTPPRVLTARTPVVQCMRRGKCCGWINHGCFQRDSTSAENVLSIWHFLAEMNTDCHFQTLLYPAMWKKNGFFKKNVKNCQFWMSYAIVDGGGVGGGKHGSSLRLVVAQREGCRFDPQPPVTPSTSPWPRYRTATWSWSCFISSWMRKQTVLKELQYLVGKKKKSATKARAHFPFEICSAR